MVGFTPCPLGRAESTEDDCLGIENATKRVTVEVIPSGYVMLYACPECAKRYADREPSPAAFERKLG